MLVMTRPHKQNGTNVPYRYNPDFIHHQEGRAISNIGQVVFGLQDGMVSTLGAITGIAIGSQELYIVLLAGVAIISVESISMGIGSYVSSRSEKKIADRMHEEELVEIQKYPEEERKELEMFFVRDGWPRELANKMAYTASENPDLIFNEMLYRELGITISNVENPVRNGVFMFLSYILGGIIPLSVYFFLPVSTAIYVSVVATLLGLFIVGSSLTHYTKQPWFKNGMHMLVFGGIALIVGLSVGVIMRIVFSV